MKPLKDWLFGDEKSAKYESPKPDLKKLNSYGDHMGDGAVQVSFTLPIPLSIEAKEAAKLYAERMGLKKTIVACAEKIGPDFTFFVVYGYSGHSVDFTKIKVKKAEFETLEYEEIEQFIKEKFKRKIVIVGATTGSDAHTVGIDAILNRKGFAGNPGLEYCQGFKVINLRAQVENKELIKLAASHQADAILVSQLVTQQDQHLKNLKELVKLLKQEKSLSPHVLKIVGGPRMTHPIATRAGFDAGFGSGTMPVEVASFIVQELYKRIK